MFIRWLALGLMVGCGLRIPAATITWSEPMKISGQADICTLWSLDRAYALGSDHSVLVNGITFTALNAPSLQGGVQLAGSIADGQTELAVAGDGDGIFSEQNDLAKDLAVVPQEYRSLLGSGISDGGSALALNLAGLTPGRTYLLQMWINDSRNSAAAERFAGGTGISTPVQSNPTVIHGDAGQYIMGLFVADDTQQTVTFTPDNGWPLLNAFQLRGAPESAGIAIIEQPASVANYAGKAVKLCALAAGKSSLTYQWQKVINGRGRDLFDGDKYSGATNNEMIIQNLSPDDVGEYRVSIQDGGDLTASIVANVSFLITPDKLINVDINNGSSPTYKGDGVLMENSGFDVWNGIAGQDGFTNTALVDSSDAETPVTMTLAKPREDGYTRDNIKNDLLKDYSPATVQTVTLKHLEPKTYYDLVVYCIGRAPNEGGALSGAIEGIVHGGIIVEDDFWVSRFLLGTNYIRNPFAQSDADGTLQFTIKATSTVFSDGYVNGDFNGMQIMKAAANQLVPLILLPPKPTGAYPGQPVALNASAIAPPSSQLTYQWQKVSTNNLARDLTDDFNRQGATNQTFVISNLVSASAGNYRVIIGGTYGSVTSAVVKVSLLSSPELVNVDIKNESAPVPVYNGPGVLHAFGGNYWNGINGRSSFQNASLLDSDGNPTIVTISLLKNQMDSYTSPKTSNNLLKDYSVGHPQTVVLKNLEPNSHYRLVVYSYGAMEKEGGVFTGAVNGIVHGWSGSPNGTTDTFIQGTNYIENDSVVTDVNGTITFIIQPNSTAMPSGFYNADFNGLQIMREE